jgi:hypothetical protein
MFNSSVAIVDRAPGYNQIIGSVSMTDLKEVFSEHGGFKHLYENVMTFFKRNRMAQGLESGDRMPVYVVHPSTRYV